MDDFLLFGAVLGGSALLSAGVLYTGKKLADYSVVELRYYFLFGEKAPPKDMKYREMLGIANEYDDTIIDPIPQLFHDRVGRANEEYANSPTLFQTIGWG